MAQQQQHAAAEIITTHLEKPLQDDSTYKVIKLPNELEALIIHDPGTDKAGAALSNEAGSFSDKRPGLAHAVEHLLTQGTRKVCHNSAHAARLSTDSAGVSGRR